MIGNRSLLVLLVPGLLSLAASSGSHPPSPPSFVLVARCDPEAHRIEATATLVLRDMGAGEPTFELNPGLTVREIRLDGERAPFESAPPAKEHGKSRVTVRLPDKREGAHRYAITYDGTIFDPPRVAEFSRERVADQTEGTIQAEGVFLSPDAGWYPRIGDHDFSAFELRIALPAGWEAVSEGSLKDRRTGTSGTTTTFAGRWPEDGLDLVAGRFKRIEEDHKGIVVAAYVFAGDEDLARQYIPAVERYLDMYTEWFGPYAYDRFTVVENFFATGYGMPGFTLLGREVMRLPFIVSTSLGHEVAHNWWGNGVFVEEKGGNWCEGLTTYVADYHYKELESAEAAAGYRREMCRDYTNYVSDSGRDFPLTDFTERSTPATRAVGYGKSMMVFHMLERRIGKERFDAVLRRVYREHVGEKVSWGTWKEAFSSEAGEDLGWFFDQWVRKPGAPILSLDGVALTEVSAPPASEGAGEVRREGEYLVTARVVQKDGAFRIRVPLVFEQGERRERRTIEADAATSLFEARVPFRPATLRLDPDQDVFRRLDPMEMPPVLSRVLGDPKALFVVDDLAGPAMVRAYRDMAATLTRTGEGEVADASSVTAEKLRGRTVFLLGRPRGEAFGEAIAGLPEEVAVGSQGFSVLGTSYGEPGSALLAVGRDSRDPARCVALFLGLSPEAVTSAGRKIVHYGKYSYLAFVKGDNKAKGVAKASGGPTIFRFDG